MSEWKEEKLADVVVVDREQLSGSTESNYAFYYIDISSVSTNKIDLPSESILFRNAPSRARKVLNNGDILVSTVRPNLKSFARFEQPSSKRFVASTGFAVLSEKAGTDLGYVYQYILSDSIERQIESLVVGSNYPAINTSELKGLRVKVPPLPIQRKIARILSTIDGQIGKTEAIIAKYQAVKQGMLQDLFTRGIDSQTGQLRRLYNQNSQRNREYIFPLEWACVKIGGYLLKIEQGWSPNCDDAVALINEWGILKTTAVKWEGYNDQENKKLPTTLKPRKEYEVKEEDVLVTRAGPNSRVGVVALVEKTRSHLIFSDKIYRLSPSLHILPAFLSLALSSDYTQSHLSTFKTGMAESQTNISQRIIKALDVLLPSVDEQYLFVERITSINNLIGSEKQTLSKLKVLKQGLMQDLLSGKVAVKA